MVEYKTEYEDSHVKILFELEQDDDGYPPEKWESLWAIPVSENTFKLDNIPFYVPRVSCDDIVTAKKQGEEYLFQGVQEYSENSTIRMIVYDVERIESVRKRLVSFGCDVEKSGTLGFIALNIPAGAQIEKLIFYLKEGHDADLWDYEEASLRF
jgi:hypothetical protein